MPADHQMSMQTHTKVARRNDDYIGLFPPGVMPTGEVDLLRGEDGSMLIIKTYEFKVAQEIPKAQMRMWKTLVAFGQQEKPRGEIMVALVWGLGAMYGMNTGREWITLDHRGVSPVRSATLVDWRQFLREWWLQHGGRP